MIRRRLFTIASAISLLLCVATVGLWIDSQLAGEHSVTWGTSPRQAVGFDATSIWFKSDVTVSEQQIAAAMKQFAAEMSWRATRRDFELVQTVRLNVEDSGFQHEILDYRATAIPEGGFSGIPWTSHSLGQRRSVVISFWWPLFVSLLVPWAAVLRLLHGRMLAVGDRCRTCGYDLPGFFRLLCPECRAIKSERAAFSASWTLTLFLCATVAVTLDLPLWLSAVGMSLMPIAILWCAGRRHTELAGRCRNCSYNLTFNTSGVCPECGTPVPKAPADKSPRPA